MTVTGFIGKVCMWPLRAIIRACVALGLHPNTLTLIGVLINVAAACALGVNRFMLAGVIMIVANIFDFIDGKVAQQTNTVSRFGAFWDSTLDRFSDIALFLGVIYLYATLHRTDYVMVASLAMMFSIMTSYARARAESLIDKCKVGFMERPERIVLFMIGAFTHRMGAAVCYPAPVKQGGGQPYPLPLPRARGTADPCRVDPAELGLLARIFLARR